jgi:ABC-type Fe3+/spermidine/putrescine transport system ATPase subunit
MIPIAIHNVVKTFGPVRALDDVSLEILPGELFFLLGPSGCGKTTLLRSLAGFYVPDAGRILFGGRDVTRVPPQRRNTAMVFQNYALWPHMTVEANVAFGLAVRKAPRAERRRRAAEALEMVRMGQYGRRRPNQLSGGQQQRVALARALVVRPQCLLLDEPLSNLDAKLRLEMRTEIRRLCKEFGLTGVYVTHDQKEALSIADRMAVMFDGRIGQLGPPRELYMRPANAATADFLGETNFLKATAGERHEGTKPRSHGGERESHEATKARSHEGEEGGPEATKARSHGGEETTLRRFATAVGEIVAAGAGETLAGRSCTLSIRPEAIEVQPATSAAAQSPAAQSPAATSPAAQSPGVNRFEARVAETLFLGETLQLTLDAGGLRLRANIAERSAAPEFVKGMAVVCTVDPRDVIALEG